LRKNLKENVGENGLKGDRLRVLKGEKNEFFRGDDNFVQE
jgi:hypothetical protein